MKGSPQQINRGFLVGAFEGGLGKIAVFLGLNKSEFG
jgi:hypothetical protein